MSKKLTDADRTTIHSFIDEIIDLQGLEGFHFAMAVYHQAGVKTFQYGKGNFPADDQIRTNLRMLIAQCKELDTPRARAMVAPLMQCVRYLETLHTNGYGEKNEIAGHA